MYIEITEFQNLGKSITRIGYRSERVKSHQITNFPKTVEKLFVDFFPRLYHIILFNILRNEITKVLALKVFENS